MEEAEQPEGDVERVDPWGFCGISTVSFHSYSQEL
jgi:hypothetical protein